MRVLVVGSGGREHALAQRLGSEGQQVIVAPGGDGIALDATCVPVGLDDAPALVRLCRDRGVDVCVVGPEQPLVDGLADRLRDAGVPVVGPGAAAAELEGSKAAAKAFMATHGIPTARYVSVTSPGELPAALAEFDTPPVVKASGLAAGKGVTVAEDFDTAREAALSCLQGDAFGAAGHTVVLEERLRGQEVSVFALTDGEHALTFLPAQDHKRIGDGDTGPNTGGMGAYAPAPIYTEAVDAQVRERILAPTLAGLRAEGRPLCGVLFIGLMIDAVGDARVIEYNVRFGDPEIQPLLWGLREPLGPRLLDAATGRLTSGRLAGQPAATVVLASRGYPVTSERGVPIAGLDAAARLPDVKVFHAGTRRAADGGWLTDGGRVLGVCARADALADALALAYQAVDLITFDGRQVRRDIGAAAVI
jgi:phosphoribosylamine--glycine ligase